MKKLCCALTALMLVVGVAGAARGQETIPDIHGVWLWHQRHGFPSAHFIFKQSGNHFWGIVCGPCDGTGTFPIQDGVIDGDHIVFYIDHPDLATGQFGGRTYRNIISATLKDNVISGTWKRAPGGPDDGMGGPMDLIGPVRPIAAPAANR
jgi:hypothetical protein